MAIPSNGVFRVLVVEGDDAGIPSSVVFKVRPVGPDGEDVDPAPIGSAMGVVVHGSNAGIARPTGYVSVTWIGSVEPTHMAVNDIWEEVP